MHNSTAPQSQRPENTAYALQLALLDLRVHPLHGKEPHLTDWQSRATTDPAQIRAWWEEFPGANIGYVVDAGAMVVDIDPRNSGLEGLAALERHHGVLPETWTVQTGRGDGGRHLLYRLRPGWKQDIPSCSDIAPGVQVLGRNHNVVGVGSRHPVTNHTYHWDSQCNPTTFPVMAYAPAWVGGLAVAAHRPAMPPAIPTRNHDIKNETQVSGRGGADTCVKASRVATQLRDPGNLPALLTALGYAPDLQDGSPLRCPCQHHTQGDRTPSGTLRTPRGTTKDFGVWCWVTQEFYPLTMVYHMQHGSGELSLRREHTPDGKVSEHRMSFLLWGIRLLRAAGLLHPTLVGAPSLPQDAPADAHTLWQVVMDIKAHRAVVQAMSAPVPLSYRFLIDWSGIVRAWSVARLRTAFNWLVGKGWLRYAEKYGSGVMATVLWSLALTADRALRRVCRAAKVLRTQDANMAQVADAAQTVPPPDASYPSHDSYPSYPSHASTTSQSYAEGYEGYEDLADCDDSNHLCERGRL